MFQSHKAAANVDARKRRPVQGIHTYVWEVTVMTLDDKWQFVGCLTPTLGHKVVNWTVEHDKN